MICYFDRAESRICYNFCQIQPIVLYRTETDIPAAINRNKLMWLMTAHMSVLIGSVTNIQADSLIFCLRTVSLPKFSHENNIYVMRFRLWFILHYLSGVCKFRRYQMWICFLVFNPITGLDRPWVLQEIEAPRFEDNRHMKVVRLSALRTGRLYPPGNIPGTHFY